MLRKNLIMWFSYFHDKFEAMKKLKIFVIKSRKKQMYHECKKNYRHNLISKKSLGVRRKHFVKELQLWKRQKSHVQNVWIIYVITWSFIFMKSEALYSSSFKHFRSKMLILFLPPSFPSFRSVIQNAALLCPSNQVPLVNSHEICVAARFAYCSQIVWPLENV